MAGAGIRSRIFRTLGLGVVLGAVVIFVSLSALASKVEPTTVEGNPKCADLNPAWTGSVDVDNPGNGTFTDGTVTITITNFDGNAATADWSSDNPINGVFAKGGPNGNLYTYDPPATSDTGIHPPVNPNNDTYYGWSHILFCYVASEVTPSPTPSETASETPTPTPTQTVSESPTPMPTETETATPGPSVGATETQIPGASPSTTVLGEKFGHTGADVLRWIFIGLGMVLFGVAAYVISLRGAKPNS